MPSNEGKKPELTEHFLRITISVVVVFIVAAGPATQAVPIDPTSITAAPDINSASVGSDPENVSAIEQRLRRKLDESGGDPYVLHRFGIVLYLQGKVLEARKLWDKAAATEPNLASADISVALELMKKEDITAAKLALQSSEKRNANNPHLYIAQGNLALLQRDYSVAEQKFQRAHQLNPKLMATNVWLGRFYAGSGDLAAAEAFYRTATEIAPNRSEGWVLLASVHFSLDHVQQALETLRSAEKTDPDEPLAEARLAQWYLDINDLLGAHKWCKQAVARKPDDIAPRLALARIKRNLRLNAEAKREFQVVLERGENLTALILLADLEDTHPQPEKAIKLYRRALKLDPRNVVANNNLAMLLMRLKRSPKEALRLAETAWKVLPDNPSVLSTYGCTLLNAGQAKRTKELLARAVRLNPSDSWARYAFGKLLYREKKFEAACDHLEGCLILEPTFPRKAEVLELLKAMEPERTKTHALPR